MSINWEELAKKKHYQKVVCFDGFSMSVQASATNYCSPRENDAERYDTVEVGYPSQEEPMLMRWAEMPDSPTETVYGYVPVEQVTIVIAKHGGMVEGEVPPGVVPLRGDVGGACHH
jgi:hypothetical protein